MPTRLKRALLCALAVSLLGIAPAAANPPEEQKPDWVKRFNQALEGIGGDPAKTKARRKAEQRAKCATSNLRNDANKP